MSGPALRVAVAGAGMVTRHHLPAWRRCEGVELVAICDQDRARAGERARDFGIPGNYADVEAMLDAERPDVLDVALPVDVHARAVAAAADRGIAVFCQKPLAPTLAEAEALVARVAGRVPFAVHENWRFRPQYRLARRWMAEGRLGPVHSLTLSMRSSGLVPDADGLAPALVRQPFLAALPRFLVFEVLIHHLDVARCLLGEFSVLRATLTRTSPLVHGEDTAHILLRAATGASAVVSGSFLDPGAPPLPTDRLEVLGRDGAILFERDKLRLSGLGSEDSVFPSEEACQLGYDAAIGHFVEALRMGAPFETGVRDNLETLRLVEEVYRLAEVMPRCAASATATRGA